MRLDDANLLVESRCISSPLRRHPQRHNTTNPHRHRSKSKKQGGRSVRIKFIPCRFEYKACISLLCRTQHRQRPNRRGLLVAREHRNQQGGGTIPATSRKSTERATQFSRRQKEQVRRLQKERAYERTPQPCLFFQMRRVQRSEKSAGKPFARKANPPKLYRPLKICKRSKRTTGVPAVLLAHTCKFF